MKKRIKNMDKNYIKIFLIIVILYGPILLFKFYKGHDTIYHLANIDDISYMIKNLNITKISPLIAGELGYGGSIFYPKLPHLLGGLINLVTNNAIISLKLSNILVLYLSGVFIYKLLDNLFENRTASFFGSIIYNYAIFSK